MKRFVLDYLSQQCRKQPHLTGCETGSNGADMAITLEKGERIAVYVINRAVRIPEIRETFEQNTDNNIFTLFIVDGRMMPQDNSDVEPPHWMMALHTVTHGRVYAYWCDGRRVTIRPVHLEWRWGGSPRRVEYGPTIDLSRLRTSYNDIGSRYITGCYAVVDFGEAAFWKRRDPNEGREQKKYSWREWSFGGQRKQEPRQEEPEWDPWEAFARNYGRVGNDTRSQYRNRRQRTQQPTHPLPGKSSYDLLGVPTTASFDEVKQAYRKKAREFHPDLHPEHKEKYTAKMADINAAFEAISRTLRPDA